jgi:glycosyltransferase involved in cell wall biosynthesis
MRVAFYAPLKSPDHPVPSGDRQIARLLLQALRLAGHDATLASRFRSFDRCGDRDRQARLHALGARVARRLVARLRDAAPPDVWFTYHLHHKAPDLLGPAVSRSLHIPYVVAEASLAPRQRDGPWAAGHALARDAIRAAAIVIALNPDDVEQVRLARHAGAPAASLAPFIDVAAFAGGLAHEPRTRTARDAPRLVAIAMMRDGAKLASYRVLAAALSRLRDLPWSLRIIGDGPARCEVEAAFAALHDRVSFLGARAPADIAALLGDSDIFVWPAIDEAIGVVFLEAQACGVPVVGGRSPGVAGVVAVERTGLLAHPGSVEDFAAATRRLLTDARLRERMGAAAAAYVRERHDLPAAAAALDAILRGVVAQRSGLAEGIR